MVRAVDRVLGMATMRVVDGKYDRAEHTWLAYRDVRGHARILDVYCVGRLPQVMLLDAQAWSLGHSYVPDHLPRMDIDTGIVNHLAAAARPKRTGFLTTTECPDEVAQIARTCGLDPTAEE